jgi:hypothetical protein
MIRREAQHFPAASAIREARYALYVFTGNEELPLTEAKAWRGRRALRSLL